MEKIKTGEVCYRDEDGMLHFSVSYIDENGVCSTEDKIIDDVQSLMHHNHQPLVQRFEKC